MKTLISTGVAGMVLMTFSPAHAESMTWTNGAGGVFQNPVNWSPNVVPGTNDTAVFDWTNGAYTVTWEGNITNHTQMVKAGTVTFDLGGYTYSLSRYATNRIGTLEDRTLVTFTNGTVRRLNAGHTGSTGTERFYLRGPGSALLLRNALFDRIPYYFWMDTDTRIVIDGPDARLNTIGYSIRTAGSIVVTNGGFLSASAGLALSSLPGSVHIAGPDSGGLFMWNGMHEEFVVRMDKGAVVQYGYAPHDNEAYALGSGTITLEDARWYDPYSQLSRGWRSLGPNGVLQGTGRVEMQRIILIGGSIRPGCTNRVGLLTFTGHITNAVATSVLDLELGGPTTNEYDRIRLVAGTRGTGTLYAGGILKLSAIDGYEPARETTFALIDAVEIVPAFDAIELPDWRGTWETNELYAAGEVTFVPPPGGSVILLR